MTEKAYNPFFSIILPVFNREKTISRAIISCLNQTFKDFELVIIDDCSTDKTLQYINEFKDKRIKLISLKKNQERSFARNTGIDYCNGKYVAFLDSDDLFLPQHLEKFKACLRKLDHENVLVFSNSLLEYSNGYKTKKYVPFLDNKNIFSYLLKYTPNPSRVCVSKYILDSYKFDIQIPGLEDFDLWLRIATKFEIYHICDYTSIYSIHEDMYSVCSKKRIEGELKMFKYIFKKDCLKNYLPKKYTNRLLSMCHFHLANFSSDENLKIDIIKHSIKSFLLYPKGYNGRTNKILFVNLIYSIPIISFFMKKLIFKIKNQKLY